MGDLGFGNRSIRVQSSTVYCSSFVDSLYIVQSLEALLFFKTWF